MRGTDMLMAFPPLLLALIIVTALGGSLANEILAIGVALTPNFVRLARSLTLTIPPPTASWGNILSGGSRSTSSATPCATCSTRGCAGSEAVDPAPRHLIAPTVKPAMNRSTKKL
jgi:ABC-type dipeptide/oligopeptide/nickel transport system permease subunit